MKAGVVAPTIAGTFSLAAFAVAIVAGLSSGTAATTVLMRAIICLFLCYPLGYVIGRMAQVVVDDHLSTHRDDNPAIDSDEVLAGLATGGGTAVSADSATEAQPVLDV